MIVFWISAALVSAAAAALVVHRAARGARLAGREDPVLAVYRRQLTEIDDLAERGLLLDEEKRSARTEAARRLLAAADGPGAGTLPGRSGRIAIAVVAAAAPLAAIGLYLLVGSPDFPDQPFAHRLAAWRKADPQTLTPEQMAAVLQLIARERPDDPKVYYFLSRAQLAEGDSFSAVQSLQRAIALDRNDPDLWTALAETYMAQAGAGEPTPDAVKAFQRAAALDPAAPTPRYYLARARIAAGDVDGGLAAWRALDHDLPATDPRRGLLQQQIAVVAHDRALPQAPAGPGGGSQDQQAFIRTMVSTLAARLQASPDDPEGWARLIRSYAVLGDRPAHDAALARARALFKDRPDALRLVESASAAPQK